MLPILRKRLTISAIQKAGIRRGGMRPGISANSNGRTYARLWTSLKKPMETRNWASTGLKSQLTAMTTAKRRIVYKALFVEQDVHHLARSLGHRSAGTEYCGHARLVKEVIVLRRNDSAGNHHYIITAELFKLFYELRDKRLMSGGQRRNAYHVHVDTLIEYDTRGKRYGFLERYAQKAPPKEE